MTKQVAVAVIHGMGSQAGLKPDPVTGQTFSSDLYKWVRHEMGGSHFDSQVVWKEIVWADILQTRQENYLKLVEKLTRYGDIRNFILRNLSDAASYRLPSNGNDTVYQEIHDRVRQTVSALADEVDPGTPLVVLAHSLGGHIISNYIYDKTHPKGGNTRPDGFAGLRKMAAFVTFGCNIPIFTFAYPNGKVTPIAYPGTDIPENQRLKVWWPNYYDKDDVLGYPLRPTSPAYAALDGLKDYPIDVGNWKTFWNPWSHNGYWKDPDFCKPVAILLKDVLAAS